MAGNVVVTFKHNDQPLCGILVEYKHINIVNLASTPKELRDPNSRKFLSWSQKGNLVSSAQQRLQTLQPTELLLEKITFPKKTVQTVLHEAESQCAKYLAQIKAEQPDIQWNGFVFASVASAIVLWRHTKT
eukprot:TRINITY_DN2703_c0_g3_i1.p2 TRINITY_DN2703_c0_g3~~TRINITY_DN2703_c0_g3_i1.p2  ORF type:complete len:131 (+),score=23.43 TRINITY_DN2703_c0_g3_i1:1343-1735(+)